MSGERVRIREKEADYIRQIATQYNESFLDALYRIVNHHRDGNLVKNPVIEIKAVKKELMDDVDLSTFE